MLNSDQTKRLKKLDQDFNSRFMKYEQSAFQVIVSNRLFLLSLFNGEIDPDFDEILNHA